MPVCPLDFRYGRDVMKEIFSEQSKLEHYLEVEASLAEALEAEGAIPEGSSLIAGSTGS